MGQYTGLSPDQLLNLWMTLNDGWPFAQRDLLIKEMQKRGLFPDSTRNILDGGIYPDTEDPNFIARLLKKTEFADTVSTFDPNEDPCKSGPGFEVTPVQRFVATFLHPRTPYRSMLLYHGVGVGKTCAAIQAAEAYLDIYPRRPIIIVAPPNIQPGFERTIFDMERLVIGVDNSPNRMDGCTGDTYLRLTGCVFERDPKVIAYRIKKAIKYRYRFYGYRQFSGRIKKTIAKVQMTGNDEVDTLRIRERLRNDLDFHFLIIDEAHNLADVKGTATSLVPDDEDLDTQGSVEEKEELRAGKILTPFLRKLLEDTEGMKLLLMTATPMFNSVFEIKFLLDLMLLNDNKSPIADGAILNKDGTLTDTADQILKPIANAYVSFMRGENPNSFPLRLFPEQGPGGLVARISKDTYPRFRLAQKSPMQEVTEFEKESMSKLPLVRSEVREGTLAHLVLSELTSKKIAAEGTKFTVIDSLLQAGNCVFPVDDDPLENPEAFVGSVGFNATFKKMGRGVVRCSDPSWLDLENLGDYSPKLASIVELINYAEGVQFAYSRFVSNGAYILALALEANGYTPYGRETGYLANGIQSPGGRQCAFCPKREENHDADHPFLPAKFVLLTGDKELSPRNNESISAARGLENKDGGIIKVVIGSTIAGEGLDLRFIRETHILDAWFHLNKTEQIIGRGIRFCSHSSLDLKKRNTTVYLHCVTFPALIPTETADLFCYRYALSKAVLIGKMSRKLKIFALDCNLRKGATVLKGLGRRIQLDSQRHERRGDGRGISLDDMDFTVMCDWMECEYSCIPDETVNIDVSDDSTYDAFSSRYRETMLKGIIQKMFNLQPYYKSEDFLNVLLISGIPTTAVFLLLQGVVNNPLFRIHYEKQEGYLVYKNGYFLFQPDRYKDVLIPMALRIADVPIKQDEFDPRPMEKDILPPIKGEEAEDKSESLWGMLQTWAKGVADGSVTTLDIAIERKLETIIDSKQMLEVLKDKLRMVLFMAKKITDKTIFEKILLEYFWDCWMSVKEQVQLLLKTPDYESLASEMVIKNGAVTAIRSVNPETGILEFIGSKDGKGEPIPPGVREALMRDTIDRKANITAVGDWYGFYVPKRGGMVFKINKPHEVGKKPKGGQEICGRSGSGNWREPIIDLQKSLPPMGFDEKSLIGSGISNNIQGCTVVELCMRYMDEKEIDGKRWFFRPVASFMTGHTGQISQTAKLEVKAVLAEQKKAAAEEKKGAKAEKKKTAVRLKPEPVQAPAPGKRTLKLARAPVPAPPQPSPAPEESLPGLIHYNNMTREQQIADDERAMRTQAYYAQAQAPEPNPVEEELIDFENQGVIAQPLELPPASVEELIDFENQGVVAQPLEVPPAPVAPPLQASAPKTKTAKPKKPTIKTERGQNE